MSRPPRLKQFTYTINENASATLSGSFSDPDAGESHKLTITWGDGTNETVNVAPGPFTISHLYRDDNPTATASDVNTISVTVEDGSGASASGNTTITVNNVNPVVGAVSDRLSRSRSGAPPRSPHRSEMSEPSTRTPAPSPGVTGLRPLA